MNTTSAKTGFVLSIVSLFSFFAYTLCFVAILFAGEPFTWTNIHDFSLHEAGNPVLFKYLGMGCMILFSCAFVVMVACMHPSKRKERTSIFHVALSFAVAFCVTISINYFVQLSATRLQLMAGVTEGLEQFTQAFSISAINAINMLGWTLFYAIASLALSFLFDQTRLGRNAKFFCLANAVMMLAGMVGYLLNNYAILFVTMNAGLGATSIAIIITMGLFFRKNMQNK